MTRPAKRKKGNRTRFVCPDCGKVLVRSGWNLIPFVTPSGKLRTSCEKSGRSVLALPTPKARRRG